MLHLLSSSIPFSIIDSTISFMAPSMGRYWIPHTSRDCELSSYMSRPQYLAIFAASLRKNETNLMRQYLASVSGIG